MDGLRAPLMDQELEQSQARNLTTPTRAFTPGMLLSPSRRESIAAQRESKRRLLQGLWCTGVFLRLLTVGNGLALLVATGYAIYKQLPGIYKLAQVPVRLDTLRACIEFATPVLCGFFLLALEWGSTFREATTRATLGFAFAACGRFLMFFCLTIVSASSVLIVEQDSLEFLMLAVHISPTPHRAPPHLRPTCVLAHGSRPPPPPASQRTHLSAADDTFVVCRGRSACC